MRYGIALAVLLAGCSNTAWQVSAGVPPPPSAAHIHVDSSSVATVLGVALIAGSLYEAARYGVDYQGGYSRTPPEMAPDRRVSEQDCTKPIDYTLGNIRCK